MTQSVWQDQDRKPRGMANFSKWRVSSKQMQDIDGLIHNKANNNFIIVEFKPQGKTLSVGQDITLTGFSLKEGCTAFCIFDTQWMDEEAEYEQSYIFRVITFKDGKKDIGWLTLANINQAMDEALGL